MDLALVKVERDIRQDRPVAEAPYNRTGLDDRGPLKRKVLSQPKLTCG
jgi:hypothetical protein